ncbi:MAG TPA: hypothetical protein VJS42_21175 [Steroidobacteraceae bacterium]|nr:hypothetical protein [Steroidobacteraceae bacterium]
MIRKSEALFALLAILLAILFMAAGATKIVFKRSIIHDAPARTLLPKYSSDALTVDMLRCGP